MRVPGQRVSEKQLGLDLEGYLTMRGWRYYHTHDARHSAGGWPDYVVLGYGQLLIVELKAEDGRLTPAQGQWLHELARQGSASVALVRGVDGVHELIEALENARAAAQRGDGSPWPAGYVMRFGPGLPSDVERVGLTLGLAYGPTGAPPARPRPRPGS